MGFGIRSQVLVTLAVVLGVGSAGSYLVTSELTRQAVIEARIRHARSVAALAAERFVGVPTEGLALTEALARVRPLALPDLVYVLGPDLEPVLDGPEEEERFAALVRPVDLAPLRHHTLRHQVVSGRDGSPVLAVVAPFEGAPRRPGQEPVETPSAVAVLSPLASTLAGVERVERIFLLFTLTLLAGAMVLGYVLLGRVVIRPVESLKRLVDRVGEGDLQPAVRLASPRGAGEVAELFRSFTKMTEELHADRRRIGLQLSELEHANREIASAQERLVRTEKLASVGELAAGLAHEIGNPIGVVQGYLEILSDPSLPPERRAEYVAIMQGAVDRVSTVLRDLLDFARPADDSDPRCDATAAARAAVKLVGPQKRFRDLRLTLDLPPVAVPVPMPQGRLEQVLLNLLFNAADASPPGGAVVVSVRPDEARSEVRVSVRDDGTGIAETDLGRIFDPFFTTKDPGAGTGLGLSICHGLVQSWGGRLEVDSTLGRGSTFTVVLPTPPAPPPGPPRS